MKRSNRSLVGLLVGPLIAFALGPARPAEASERRSEAPSPIVQAPTAVVMLVGDGLGFSQIALARYASRARGERLAFEAMPVTGLVSTWSASNVVTDSGAAATAFAAGVKTDNRFLGLDPARRPVRTLGEAAKEAGWRVGYVTTTRITHATPACFYAHHGDRYDEQTVAAQLLDADVDVALGGGLASFLPTLEGGTRTDGRDLVAEARSRGIEVQTRPETPHWDGNGRLLGLYARSHLAYELDDRNLPPERRDPTLATLARVALDGLSRSGQPFFLMIEGGRIDHAGHDFDAAGLVAETLRFDEATASVLAWADEHPEALVLLTADHATGGLAINDHAHWDALAKRSASISWLTSQIRNAGAGVELLAERTGEATWSEDEVRAVREAFDSYEANRRLGRMLAERDGFTWSAKVTDDDTHGHTGEDVPLYATGRSAAQFGGVLDNAEIAQRLARLLDWRIGLQE